MFSWNVLWSTVLMVTVTPDDVLKPSITLARTSLGFGSDWFEPSETLFASPPEPESESESPHPASAPVPSSAPAPAAPASSERRFRPATDGGTSRARYSACERGRDIAPPAWRGVRRDPPRIHTSEQKQPVAVEATPWFGAVKRVKGR